MLLAEVVKLANLYYIMLKFCYRYYVNSQYQLTKKVVGIFACVWAFSIVLHVVTTCTDMHLVSSATMEIFALYCPPIFFFQALILGRLL